MKFAFGVVTCLALSVMVAMFLIPIIIRLLHLINIVIMYSMVAYQSSKPQGIRGNVYFVFILIGTYPRLLEICRKAENHEPKL